MGDLSFVVLDKLTAPSTVSSSITALVEVCGGPDYEVSCPTKKMYIPLAAAIPQSGWKFQSGAGGAHEKTMVSEGIIGGAGFPSSEVAPAQLCIGEKIVSLRQLLKKYTGIPAYVEGAPTIGSSIIIDPFGISWASSILGLTSVDPYFWNDYYGAFGCCFALHRGGVRLRVYQTTTTDTNYETFLVPLSSQNLTNAPINTITPDNPLDFFTKYNSCQYVVSQASGSGGAAVQVPQYHFNHSRCTVAESYVGQNIPNLGAYEKSSFGVIVDATAVDSSGLNVTRSFGEDGNFGFFVSVPPMRRYA
jgi:hypothetical protein